MKALRRKTAPYLFFRPVLFVESLGKLQLFADFVPFAIFLLCMHLMRYVSVSHQHILCRHRLIFPGRRQPSIFSADELNFRVRYGNGWILIAINTDFFSGNTLKIE